MPPMMLRLDGLLAVTWSQIITAVGGWAVITAGMAAFLSKLLTERLVAKWQRDEQALVETLRNELESDREVFQAAIGSFQAGQASVLEARLAAVQRLWKGVLKLREEFSGVVFFFTILLPSEYDDALARDDSLAAGVKDVNDHTITDRMQRTSDLEADRALLGETLWLRFFIYRSFLGRLAILLSRGRDNQHVEDWRGDRGVGQLLGYVLPGPRVEAIMGSSPNDVAAIQRAVNEIESLILEEMAQLTSGKRSSDEGSGSV